jgi:hypothetical protein
MDMKGFKKGAAVAYRMVGWGITNYEGPDVITGIKGGRIFTETYDKFGFEWDEMRKSWRFSDGFSSLTATLVLLEDEQMFTFLKAEAKGDRSLEALLAQVIAHRAKLEAAAGAKNTAARVAKTPKTRVLKRKATIRRVAAKKTVSVKSARTLKRKFKK